MPKTPKSSPQTHKESSRVNPARYRPPKTGSRPLPTCRNSSRPPQIVPRPPKSCPGPPDFSPRLTRRAAERTQPGKGSSVLGRVSCGNAPGRPGCCSEPPCPPGCTYGSLSGHLGVREGSDTPLKPPRDSPNPPGPTEEQQDEDDDEHDEEGVAVGHGQAHEAGAENLLPSGEGGTDWDPPGAAGPPQNPPNSRGSPPGNPQFQGIPPRVYGKGSSMWGGGRGWDPSGASGPPLRFLQIPGDPPPNSTGTLPGNPRLQGIFPGLGEKEGKPSSV